MNEKQYVLRFACVVIAALVSWQCSESENGEDLDVDAGEPDFNVPDATDSIDMPFEDADMEIPDEPSLDIADAQEDPEEEEIEEPNPTGLGPGMNLGAGKDPDVAVDSLGLLHVVYSRDHSTYYRKVVYPSDPGTEILVGGGSVFYDCVKKNRARYRRQRVCGRKPGARARRPGSSRSGLLSQGR